jgi:hypothetical protein
MLRLLTSCYDTCGNPSTLLYLWAQPTKGKDCDYFDSMERGIPIDPDTMQSSISSECNYLEPPEKGYQRRSSEQQQRRSSRSSSHRRGSYDDTLRSDRTSSSVPSRPFGKIRVAAQYSFQKKLLIVTVVEVVELEDETGALYQIRLAALSAEKTVKQRTKFRSGPHILFNQTYAFGVPEEHLQETVVRLRLYKKRSTGRYSFLGEAYLKASTVESGSSTHLLRLRTPAPESNLSLLPIRKTQLTAMNGSPKGSVGSLAVGTPPMGFDYRQTNINATASASPRRGSMVDDSGRFCALPDANGTPELLISLCYLANQSKVIVGLEKASGFDTTTINGNKLPDTFVKVTALSQYGDELGKHKSGTFKSSSDPSYQDTAVFQIQRHDLETSSVLIQVFGHCGILRRKVCLGWLCLGENASSPDAQQHWWDMVQGMGTTVDKWHHLLKPELK